MFTGIIQSAGKIDSFKRAPALSENSAHENTARLRVRFTPDLTASAPLALGASIAVNGCCLTVIEADADSFAAELSSETLARTAFAEKKPGDCVNLERPLAPGAELGGHIVQGHVDGAGRVQSILPDGDGWTLAIAIPPQIAGYVVEKGSLAVDGISLTVARWSNGIAEIAVIPFTYLHTNVCDLRAGDAVNLECDVLAKYVERLLAARAASSSPAKTTPPAITMERLTREGF